MRHLEPDRVSRLVPMLDSISREIEERRAAIVILEHRIAATDRDDTPRSRSEGRALVAESAVHKRELRMARHELERLGCSIVGDAPLTLRIVSRSGEEQRSCVWQRGAAVLRWA